MPDPAWLPALVRMEEYDGDWNRYVGAVYAVFRRDFVENPPRFRGNPVRVGKQLIDGRERTFWHLTSEGEIESRRTPDLRRCERIAWLRPLIEHENDPSVLRWPNRRGRGQRHVLWLKEKDFVVILEKRAGSWWLWTAYRTDRPHTRQKLQEEYEGWRKANAAPCDGHGVRTPSTDGG